MENGWWLDRWNAIALFKTFERSELKEKKCGIRRMNCFSAFTAVVDPGICVSSVILM